MMNRVKTNSVIKRDFKVGNLIKKIAKANGAIAIASLALFLGACDTNDKIGTVEPIEQTPGATATGDTTTEVPPTTENTTTDPGTTGAALPDATQPDATDNTGAESPNAKLVGENVTVSTKVKEIVGPKAFIAYDKESLGGQDVLVVSNEDAPAVGTNVEVSGVMENFDPAAIKKDYGLDLNSEVVKTYENKPYLAAKAIEKVD